MQRVHHYLSCHHFFFLISSLLLFTRKIKIFERCDLSAEGWPVAGLAHGAGAGMGGVSGTGLRVLRAAYCVLSSQLGDQLLEYF